MKRKFQPPDICTCAICGYGWMRGQSGSHDCIPRLQDKLRELKEENRQFKLLSLAAESLLLASTGPEDGPTSYTETKNRWMTHMRELVGEVQYVDRTV